MSTVGGALADHGGPRAAHELDPYDVVTRALALARSGAHPQVLNRELFPHDEARNHAIASEQSEAFDALARRLAVLSVGRTTVSIVSDDPIMREGLDSVLSRYGIVSWPSSFHEALVPAAGAWDYVLVWLPSREGIDPFGSISQVGKLAATGVPVVAVYPGRITPLVRLRLSEAGARYALPQWWLSEQVEELSGLLSRAELPARYHLGTPLSIRQEIGLLLVGRLAPLIAAAQQLDPTVWRRPESPATMLPRTQVQRLRQLALEAGVPPPVDRYSGATRRTPSTPAWRDVHRVVRGAFNFKD